MGCPACGPATGASWTAHARGKESAAEQAWQRLIEVRSRGLPARETWSAGLRWIAHVLFEFSAPTA